MMVACKLLGVPFEWMEPGVVSEWTLHPKTEILDEKNKNLFWTRVNSSKTYGAFINLIDVNADVILTQRTISCV